MYFLFGAWAFILEEFQCDAFLTNREFAVNKRSKRLMRTLNVKRAPKLEFDLEAIEEFEMQLEKLESAAGSSIKDSEDDNTVKEIGADTQTVVIPPGLDGKRIDAAIADLIDPPLSRSVCGNLVANGNVRRVSSADASQYEVIDRKSFKVEAGMKLEISLPKDESPTEIVAQNIPLDILYEDEHMIVLNKAANMVVHPAAGNWDGTIVNALAYYLPRSAYGRGDFIDENGTPISAVSQPTDVDDDDDHFESADGEQTSFRPGIVHRLDKGTTGVLVVAKTSQALTALSAAFAARKASKTYLAVTVGNPGERVKIDKPIGRHPVHRQRMRVVPDPHQKNSSNRLVAPRAVKRSPAQAGRRAVSYVDTLAFDGKLGLARVRIVTGRTHQIRVHLQDRHTPIYGDDVYGLADWNKRLSKAYSIDRPLLHAYKLSICHPITGEQMEFTAPLDPDMKRIARTIVPNGSEEELSNLLQWD